MLYINFVPSGTQNLHLITSQGAYELRIELTDWEGKSRYAKYQTFKVGSSLENYVLTADGYEGDAGKSPRYLRYYRSFCPLYVVFSELKYKTYQLTYAVGSF